MRKKVILDFIFVEFSFFIIVSSICGYGIYYLMSIGFSSTQAGTIVSIGNVFSLLVQPFISNIADKSKKYNSFRLSIIFSSLTLISCLLLFFQKNASTLVIALFVSICCYYEVIESLTNSIPSLFEHKGLNLPFGLGRAFGSASYALGTYLLGIIIEKNGIKSILISLIISSVLMIISYTLINNKFNALQNNNHETENKKVIPYSLFLKRHKIFLILIIAEIGIFFGYTISDNFMVMVVENVGGNAESAGTILGIKALLEIPIIFFYEKIEKIFKTKKLLIVSVICLTIKSFLVFFSSSTTTLLFAQFIQPLSIGFFIPSMVSYINQIMDKDEATRGQSLSIMAMTIATILSSPIGGMIAENYSVKSMLLVGAIISAISTALFCFTILKKVNNYFL